MSGSPAEELETELYQRLLRNADARPTSSLLEDFGEQLIAASRYVELFEVLKISLRHRLGLPLLASPTEQLDDQVQEAYETGLLDACRRVGMLLLDAGRVRDAWAYLRPVGDQRGLLSRLAHIPVTAENVDQLVEVLLYEGVDPPRGYQLLLEHFGTCNAITAFQSALYGRPRPQRAAAAGLLVGHLYRELLHNVSAHAARIGLEVDPGRSLSALLADSPQLISEGGYHIDTTHLSSVINMAREVTDRRHLAEALELTDYGARLDPSFQYASDPPFEETYTTHRLWFAAQLGTDIDAAVGYLKERAESSQPREQGTQVIEYYVDLLDRLGRPAEALRESLRLIPVGVHTVGWAPSLLELAHRARDYEPLIGSARSRGELLGFLLGLLGRKGEALF